MNNNSHKYNNKYVSDKVQENNCLKVKNYRYSKSQIKIENYMSTNYGNFGIFVY